MRAWIVRHPLATFFGLAYACSWSVAIPLALQAQGLLQPRLPWAFHYLTAFGPAIAALIVRRLLPAPDVEQSPSPRAAFGGALFWWTVGFALPLASFVAAQGIASVAGQSAPTWTSLGEINFLPALGIGAWFLWFATSGIGEELGWRGFALPRLQRSHSALASSALLAIAWAGWHVPAFFYVPSYRAIGLAIVPGFFLGILAGAIVLTWLYNSSGGRLLPVVLWHASFNFVSGSPNASGLVAAVTSTLVMVWAVAIVLRYGPSTLTSLRSRRWSIDADASERTRSLPGDELIADPIGSFTHAITIRRPRREVWPWLVQMGAGTRGGWYSYDVLDNGRRPSADRIIPELQHVTVGTIFPAMPGVRDGFTLLAFEQDRFLLLGWRQGDEPPLMTWAFVLEDAEHGWTRLTVRARGGSAYRSNREHWWQSERLLPLIHFVMERRQLLGIARRAEMEMSSAR